MKPLLDWLDRWERRLCTLAFSVLASVLFADVVMREVSGNGLPWAVQTGVFANVVLALFGLGLATGAGTHLRPRFADHWLPDSWDAVLRRASHVITALILLVAVGFSAQLVLETRVLDETATVLRIPLWPLQALIPLSFLSAAVRCACFALNPALAPENA
jgi:TRAP-type C4-dicarboxylate transport system permease small subunit